MNTAYYNEFDPHAAAWLRVLIAKGLIAYGVVDERSIEDVTPGDLAGFTQCHFFAGIGGWPLALRLAGIPDWARIWTGSCPCQPFSEAGQGGGFADERHLWPAFFHLIGVGKPPVVFGEQVASKDADPWLDLVQTDMEALDYALGAIAFPAAGVGAPHLRDRTYWVADATGAGSQGSAAGWADRPQWLGGATQRDGAPGQLAHAQHDGRDRSQGFAAFARGDESGIWIPDGDRAARSLGHADGDAAGRDAGAVRGAQAGEGWGRRDHDAGASSYARRLADADQLRLESYVIPGLHDQEPDAQSCGRAVELADAAFGGWLEGRSLGGRCSEEGHGLADGSLLDPGLPGPNNGYWRAADWLGCRDGKWRAVEPGTQPLATGLSGRVGALRGYGNAINVEAAKAFIETWIETKT